MSSNTPPTTKFKVEQSIPKGSVRKGPYAVERSIDPNDVVITRRFGEGSKPLFDREDIAVNVTVGIQPVGGKAKEVVVSKHKARHSSTDSSSPERYRSRESHQTQTHARSRQSSHHRETDKSKHSSHTRTKSSPLPSRVPQKRRTPDKVPYFLDEVREKDRLRRIYGNATTTSQPRKHRSRSRSPSPVARQRTRSRYEGSSTAGSQRSHQTRLRDSTREHNPHYRNTRARSPSPPRFHRRYHYDDVKRRRNSRSPNSRSRSREREKIMSPREYTYRRSSQRNPTAEADQSQLVPPPAPQIITIPVPVPDYSFSYPTWPPPQHAWGAQGVATHPAPTRFAPFYPAMMSPLRPLPPPSPYGYTPYGARMYRQPYRYTAPRPNRGALRPPKNQ